MNGTEQTTAIRRRLGTLSFADGRVARYRQSAAGHLCASAQLFDNGGVDLMVWPFTGGGITITATTTDDLLPRSNDTAINVCPLTLVNRLILIHEIAHVSSRRQFHCVRRKSTPISLRFRLSLHKIGTPAELLCSTRKPLMPVRTSSSGAPQFALTITGSPSLKLPVSQAQTVLRCYQKQRQRICNTLAHF